MTKQEAIEILQKHIDTYKHQLSDEGWDWMVRRGIVSDTMHERLMFKQDAGKQVKAYQMAIAALSIAD